MTRMKSYLLVHRQTGTALPGYRVLAATPEEISTANQNLTRTHAQYRYVSEALCPRESRLTNSSL